MQIGNSRSNSPLPQDPKNSGLDPDLTRVNRESIEKSTKSTAERTEEARKNLAANPKTEMAPTRDKFERSRPQEDVGVDVGDRIKNARAQAARTEHSKNERIDNARKQHGSNVKNVETDRAMAARIEGARSQHDDKQMADRIDGARSQHADMQMSDRIEGARAQHAEAPAMEKRIDSARAQHADQAMANRIEGARSNSFSRESVELSGKSRSMASNDLPGVGGRSESDIQRAERLEGLRIANARGELNSPERVRRAAGRLLGGE